MISDVFMATLTLLSRHWQPLEEDSLVPPLN
jgi:hypothetical protein